MSNQRKITTKREVPKNCIFCREKKNPYFMEIDVLGKYTTERGKILSASKTGVCSKHQKKLTTSIKRARFLALMPFVVKSE